MELNLNEVFNSSMNKVNRQAYLMIGDKIYELKYAKAVPQTIKEVKEQAISIAYDIKFAYENALSVVEQDYKKKANLSFRAGILFAKTFQENYRGWSMELSDNLDEEWVVKLTYPETIKVTHLMYEGRIVELPEQERKFDISSIALYLDSDLTIIKATAKGYNPHVSDSRQLCIGKYRRQKATPEILEQILKSLEIAVIDEGWTNSAKYEAKRIFDSLVQSNSAKSIIWNKTGGGGLDGNL